MRLATIALTATLAACVPVPPEAVAPEREARSVQASFGATWDAAIDHFAERNIPIATIERASGIIATTQLRVDPETAEESSDCGQTGAGVDLRATRAVYNVLVRGDESSSTVRVTVSWSNPASTFECVTTGEWEERTESAIAARAEGP